MDPQQRRLATLLGHFQAEKQPSASKIGAAAPFSPAELQDLLDHDNHEHRRACKAFMTDASYIP
jgi:acyl-CoA oxidase